jgi:hypothetical protein
MRDLPKYELRDGETFIPLEFDDAQSFFIIFRNKSKSLKVAEGNNFPSLRQVMIISHPWFVKFDTVWGGPSKPVLFSKLEDWTTSPEPGIKYFSGTAVYNTSFDFPVSANKNKSANYFLDLGVIKHVARVILNHKDLGILWTAPWKIMIPGNLLLSKNNELQIEVTNVWANRLIGDEQQPSDCEWMPGQYFYDSGKYLKEFPDWFLKKQPRPSKGRYCFTTWNYFTKDSPLVSSGLIGPVRIIIEE